MFNSDEDELKISSNGKTNDEGFATLDFEIPPNAKLEYGNYNGEIEIKGEKNGVVREADEDLEITADAFVYLTRTNRSISRIRNFSCAVYFWIL